MATSADIGYSSIYEIWDTTLGTPAYTTIQEVTDINPGNDTVDLIDATHMASPGRRREFVAGLVDGGDLSVEVNFVPGSASDILIRTYLSTGASENHRITFPNNARVTVAGIITGYDRQAPIDGKMAATITVKRSGAETWDTA